jgi:DNA-directed RNA polymerase subunit RPC12/RpoP
MKIACPQCSRIHEVQDSEAADKKIYFFCTGCGHKIVIDNRKQSSSEESTPAAIKPVQTVNFTDIIDALPHIFNVKGILYLFGYLCLSSVIFAALAVLFFKAPELSIPVKAVIAVIFTLFIHYGFLLMLYLVSKNYFSNSGILPFSGRSASLSNLSNDALSLFLVSFALIGTTTILLFPVYLIGWNGLYYGGILFPVFLFLFILIALSIIFCHYFPAHLALGEYRTTQGISEFFRFIRTEIATLPVHYFTVFIIHSIYTGILCIVFYGCFILLNCLIIMLAKFGGFSFGEGSTFIPGIKELAAGISGSSSISSGVYAFFVFLCILFFSAFLASAYQTLVSQSCTILKKNPEKSVPKGVIAIVCGIVFTISVLIAVRGFLF